MPDNMDRISRGEEITAEFLNKLGNTLWQSIECTPPLKKDLFGGGRRVTISLAGPLPSTEIVTGKLTSQFVSGSVPTQFELYKWGRGDFEPADETGYVVSWLSVGNNQFPPDTKIIAARIPKGFHEIGEDRFRLYLLLGVSCEQDEED